MVDTVGWYERFATEAGDRSATYAEWARRAAADPEIIGLIVRLPETRRAPYLLFAVTRLAGAPVGRYDEWRAFVVAHWPEIERESTERRTQTNEPQRCATILPALATLTAPLGLIELGAAAGLCLYPDRYSYRFSDSTASVTQIDPTTGPSAVVLECAAYGPVPLPRELPTIVSRTGIDLAPLDVLNPADRLWLETLVWPEETARLARIRAAADVVAADPPDIVVADLAVDDEIAAIRRLVDNVPTGVTPVILTVGVLVYIPFLARQRLVAELAALVAEGARWIALEGIDVIPAVRDALREHEHGRAHDLKHEHGGFVLSIDGTPVAWSSPLGHEVEWIDPPIAR